MGINFIIIYKEQIYVQSIAIYLAPARGFLIDLTAFKLNSSFGCLLAGYGSAFLTYFQRWF